MKHRHRLSRELTVILFQFYFMLCDPLSSAAAERAAVVIHLG